MSTIENNDNFVEKDGPPDGAEDHPEPEESVPQTVSPSEGDASLSDAYTSPSPEPPGPPPTAQPEDQPTAAEQAAKFAEDVDLDLLLDIPLEIKVELGRTKIQIHELLKLAPGSAVKLIKLQDEPVDILANDTLIARGEVVVQKEKYGIRVTEITRRLDRIRSFSL